MRVRNAAAHRLAGEAPRKMRRERISSSGSATPGSVARAGAAVLAPSSSQPDDVDDIPSDDDYADEPEAGPSARWLDSEPE